VPKERSPENKKGSKVIGIFIEFIKK